MRYALHKAEVISAPIPGKILAFPRGELIQAIVVTTSQKRARYVFGIKYEEKFRAPEKFSIRA